MADLGDGLVTKLADRTVLVPGMVPMPDGHDRPGTDQRDRQYHDPGAPTKATPCEPCVYGASLKVPFVSLTHNGQG